MSSERFSLDDPDWPEFLLHMQRYALASGFARNKSVLDCACGEGYGSAYLARSASQVVAVDVSESAIEICRKKYDLPNCSYQVGNITNLEFSDNTFDVVASFETFEHLEETQQGAALAELRRVLKPGGALLISTPDREVGRMRHYANPFHLHELSTDEFKRELQQRFNNVLLYSQELNMSSLLWPLEGRPSKSSRAWVDQVEVSPSGDISQRDGNIAYYYIVAICSDTRLAAPAVHSFMSHKREPAEALWSRIDTLAADVTALEAQREQTTGQRGAMTALVETRERLEQLSSAFIERFARMEQVNAHIEADRAFHLLDVRAEKLVARMANAEDERDTARAQQRALTSEVANLKAQLADALSTSNLQSQAHTVESDVQRRAVALLQEELEANQRICGQLRFDAAAQADALDTARFELGLSREQLAISERNCEQLRLDAAAQADVLDTARFELGLSREQLAISERNCEQLRLEAAARAEDVSTARYELGSSREQLAISERNCERLRIDVTARVEAAERGRDARCADEVAAMAAKLWHARVWRQALQATAEEVAAALDASGATMFKGAKIKRSIRSKLSSARLDYHIIRFSGFLSPNWYLATYPDVRASGMDPVEHYRLHGGQEMREPGPIFGAQSYLGENPDVQAAKMNPIVHFVRHGFEEGRLTPSLLLDVEKLSSASDRPN